LETQMIKKRNECSTTASYWRRLWLENWLSGPFESH